MDELSRPRNGAWHHYGAGLAHGTILGVGSRIVTERLVLEPLSQETARAVVDGAPDGLRRGDGWPHADTLDALGMVAKHGSEAWLILEDGVVVGDAGTHGPPDENRDVEIGYGLAEPARGRGLASEFVARPRAGAARAARGAPGRGARGARRQRAVAARARARRLHARAGGERPDLVRLGGA